MADTWQPVTCSVWGTDTSRISPGRTTIPTRSTATRYIRAHEEFGVAVDPELVFQGDFNENGGALAMTRLLDSGRSFSAVFAGNDQSAMGAHMVLYRRGLRVPEDISLIGFDNLPVSAYLTPPLTTVHQPLVRDGAIPCAVIAGNAGQTGGQRDQGAGYGAGESGDGQALRLSVGVFLRCPGDHVVAMPYNPRQMAVHRQVRQKPHSCAIPACIA